MKEISLTTFINNIDTHLCEVVSHAICSICQEVFKDPVTTQCSHSFCSSCINNVFSSRGHNKCPLCKQSIDETSLQNDKALWTISKILLELANAFVLDVNDFSGSTNIIENTVKRSKLSQLAECIESNKINNQLPLKINKTNCFGQVNFLEEKSDDIDLNLCTRNKVHELLKQNKTKFIKNEKKILQCHEMPEKEVCKTSVTKANDLNNKNSCILNDQKYFMEKMSTNDAVVFDPKTLASMKVDCFSPKSKKNKKNSEVQCHTLNSENELFSNSFLINSKNDDLVQKKIKRHAITSYENLFSKDEKILLNKNDSGENLNNLSDSCSNVSFSDIINVTSSDALELENGIENFLKRCETNKDRSEHFKENKINKCVDEGKRSKSTNLLNLLKEIIDDKVLYSKNSPKKPLKLPKKFKSQLDRNALVYKKKEINNIAKSCFNEVIKVLEPEHLTQSLKGFSSHIEEPQGNILKKIIAKIEKEINSKEFNLTQDCRTPSIQQNQESTSSLSSIFSLQNNNFKPKVIEKLKDQNQNFVVFNLIGKIKKNKNKFILFIKLGRFTPAIKRTKSSVVKLVFPFGLASLVKKHSRLQNREDATHDSSLFSTNKYTCWCQKKIFLNDYSLETAETTKTFQHVNACNSLKISKTSAATQTIPKSEIKEVESQTEITFLPKIIFEKSLYEWQSMEKEKIYLIHEKSADIKKSELSNVNKSSVGLVKSSPQNNIFSHDLSTRDFELLQSKNASKCFSPSNPRKRKREFGKPLKKQHLKSSKKLKNNYSSTAASDITSISKPSDENNTKKNLEIQDYPVSSEIAEASLEQTSHEIKFRNENFNVRSSELRSEVNKVLFGRETNQNKSDISSYSKIKNLEKKVKKFEKIEENNSNLEPNFKKNLKTLTSKEVESSKNDLMQLGKEIFINDLSEHSEDSDSDFFVEQTPPKIKYVQIEECRNVKNRTQIESDKENTEIKLKQSFKKVFNNLGAKTECFAAVNENEGVVSGIDEVKYDSGNDCENNCPKEHFQSNINAFRKNAFGRKNEPSVLYDDQKTLKTKSLQMQKDIEERRFSGISSVCKTVGNKGTEDAWKNLDHRSWDKPKNSSGKVYCVVASSVKNPEIVKKFTSEFKLEYSNKACREMTHLIVGLHENEDGEILPLCTPKLLFAMANKKWVVAEKWAEASLKSKKVLEEEPFETCDPVGGSGCRDARLSTDHLFKNCFICLLGDFENISKEELADIILDSGGTLVSKPEKFPNFTNKIRLIIVDKDCLKIDANELQELEERFQTVVLSRDFIIMSVQSYKLSSFSPYLMRPASPKNLIELGYPAHLVL